MAFGARFWGLADRLIDHLDICRANETWIRSEIARGTHIIDIGIDTSRVGSRSPYYALELRIMMETGYPVDRRPWPASSSEYEPEAGEPCP